ncbi:hypothetical protein SAMN04488067_10669 [Halorubrum xinjiangense]|uniref:Adhesin n=1 Tax=Halorubrum xinjiangense TaxID=261291 RepID=A0A1G7MGX0_9EURY|nr:hypothetical protein SAMN04488067_10669 [Halorubrum xinjiangense]
MSTRAHLSDPQSVSRRAFLGTGAVVAVGSLSGCLARGPFLRDEVTEAVTATFAPADVQEIRVVNAIGDATVRAVNTDEIGVRVLKRSVAGARGLEDITVQIGVEGDVLTVETTLDDDATWFTRSSPGTDVSITVPQGTAGPIVSSISSRLGNVALFDTRGDTVARTNLGDVTAARADGYLTLESELGTILADDVAGLDRVRTELGQIKVDLAGLRTDVEIGTQMGDVVVGIAETLDLDVVAESNAGVDSDLPLTGVQSGGGRVSGRLNAGGSRVHVFSDVGDVSLRTIRGE